MMISPESFVNMHNGGRYEVMGILQEGINDLQTCYPAIAKEWDFDKNGDLNPNLVTYGSPYNAWWKCDNNHSWQATVNRRTNQKSGCPFCCNKKVLTGYNDLQTKFPEIAKEWYYEKNGDLRPETVLFGSHKKVWWICENGHDWDAPIDRRTGKTKSGCPFCTNHYFRKGENDLQTTHPEILDEWHWDKNGDLKPDMVAMSSHRKVWWKCKICGYEWKAPVDRRTGKNKSGCPACSGHVLVKGKNDLLTCCPEVAEEWNPIKNGDLKPDDVAVSTNQKVWWICSKGHDWLATVNSRTGKDKNGCPYCANQLVWPGFNDLKTVFPEIAQEWNYEKNGDLKPEMIVYGSNKVVWWKCEKGHIWETSPNHRVNGNTGCPKCKKEMRTSFPEQCILYYLKKAFPDAENGNHAVLNGKELDIYIPSLSTAIEFDGGKYHENIKKDIQKYDLCNENGVRLIRVRDEFCTDLPGYEGEIVYMKSYTDDGIFDMLQDLFNILHISVNVDIKRDRAAVYSQYIFLEKENSVANKRPDIANEWNYEKNGDLKPDMVSHKSNHKVWWKCEKGHEWDAVISSRTGDNCGCPICCNQKLLSGYNDLQTVCPQIAKEWNYEKNGELKPDMILSGSDRKVWWKCEKDHEWEASVGDRTRLKTGCPYCSNTELLKGFNDLQTRCSEIAEEWDHDKNGDLKPDMVLFGSNKKVFWKCRFEHGWEAMISSRTGKRKTGCPYCAGRKVMKGFNDLQTKYPQLALEWDYEKNGDLQPDMVVCGCNKVVFWKCQYGHGWAASVNQRTQRIGSKCPICSNKIVLEGYNDLKTKFPDVAREWDYDRNEDLLPTMVVPGSGKRVCWKCKNGHLWQARIVDRTKNNGTGVPCPECISSQRGTQKNMKSRNNKDVVGVGLPQGG